MTIVYVLTERYNDYDEDTNVIGVFSTIELAQEQINKFPKRQRKEYTYNIEKFELNNLDRV